MKSKLIISPCVTYRPNKNGEMVAVEIINEPKVKEFDFADEMQYRAENKFELNYANFQGE